MHRCAVCNGLASTVYTAALMCARCARRAGCPSLSAQRMAGQCGQCGRPCKPKSKRCQRCSRKCRVHDEYGPVIFLETTLPWRAAIVQHYEDRAAAGLPLFTDEGLGIIEALELRVRTFVGEEIFDDD